MLETSLLSMLPWIEETGAIMASAGEGKVAHVTVDDVARAGAVVLTERDENGRNYVITGPELLSLGELCQTISLVTERSVPYIDLPDDELIRPSCRRPG